MPTLLGLGVPSPTLAPTNFIMGRQKEADGAHLLGDCPNEHKIVAACWVKWGCNDLQIAHTIRDHTSPNSRLAVKRKHDGWA